VLEDAINIGLDVGLQFVLPLADLFVLLDVSVDDGEEIVLVVGHDFVFIEAPIRKEFHQFSPESGEFDKVILKVCKEG